MAHNFSKENQSSSDAAYRFGDFELYPADRLLKKGGAPVPLQPKVYDALLCLISRAGHLVSKRELMNTLWPDVHVAEANLTNIIVGLRKVLGRNAIRTVSKHGYRFEPAVSGEPGMGRATYERFARAKELTNQRTLDSMSIARDLLWTCLAENPTFAAGWAYLGRCGAFFEKFNGGSGVQSELVAAAFARAFAIDPDLACAHQFYTLIQADAGQACEAIQRLVQRLKRHPGEPESLAGLVQAYRFCGLLQESLEAHRLAIKVDPAVVTSVAHTFFLNGDFAAAIDAYAGRGAHYLDAAAWAALGHRKRAVSLLRKRLDQRPSSDPVMSLMSSLLAVLEGRTRDAVGIVERAGPIRDPEIVLYFARHYAAIGRIDEAIVSLRRAAKLGFTCAPKTLREDPWLNSLRKSKDFPDLVEEFETSVQAARAIVGTVHNVTFPDSKSEFGG